MYILRFIAFSSLIDFTHGGSPPTVSPTTVGPTGQPSSEPTLFPTVQPSTRRPSTAIPSSAVPSSANPSASPSVVPTSTVCLGIQLSDLYGDGWGSDIVLSITGPAGGSVFPPDAAVSLASASDELRYSSENFHLADALTSIAAAATCSEACNVFDFCPGLSGMYSFAVKSDLAMVSNPWEIYWNVQGYEGSYGSEMLWYYDSSTRQWTFHSGYHLLSSKRHCAAAPSRYATLPQDSDLVGPVGEDNSCEADPPNNDARREDAGPGPDDDDRPPNRPKPSPRSALVALEVISPEKRGWDNLFTVDPRWYITSADGSTDYQDGSLCGKPRDVVEHCFADGDYVLKVTGAVCNDKSVGGQTCHCMEILRFFRRIWQRTTILCS
jgi:hypothetical protein